MMRSDMPKQIMAYRNGGGLPSLATAPMEFSNGGGIGSFVSNAYNKAVGVVKDALGMTNSGPPPGHPEYNIKAAQSKPNQMLVDAALPPSRRSKESLGRRIKRKRREAERQKLLDTITPSDFNERVDYQDTAGFTDPSGIMTLDSGAVGANNPDVMNAYIENILERDDLSAVEKLEFAQSLADTYGVAGGTGVQAVADNLSNLALDPTSGLSDAERVDALTSLGTATGTDYSGLINTLNNQIAANNLTNINNIATTTPGANMISNVATTPALNVATTPALNTAQNNATMVPAAPATYTGYAPIVPAANISTAGIAGLPSTNTSTIQPYTFTAFTPDAYTPAVNPLVLPPLG